MNILPIELQRLIYKDLSCVELVLLTCLNKYYYIISHDDLLWQKLIYKDFGDDVKLFSQSWYETYKIYKYFRTAYKVNIVTRWSTDLIGVYRTQNDAIKGYAMHIVNCLDGLDEYMNISKYPPIEDFNKFANTTQLQLISELIESISHKFKKNGDKLEYVQDYYRTVEITPCVIHSGDSILKLNYLE